MKTLLLVLLMLLAIIGLNSCSNTGNGELVGVPNREEWFEPQPYGMLFITGGSYNMGPDDQDVPWAMTAETKTVSIAPFWMDETEITNNEYRQFVYWVRDSIAYKLLGAELEQFLITENDYGEEINPPFINWDERIKWDDAEQREILNEMFLPEQERFYRRKELDTRKLNFEYFWIDLRQAAKKYDFKDEARRAWNSEENKYDGDVTDYNYKSPTKGQKIQIKDRSSYIVRDVVNIYPDTLCWISDFTYSFNEPMANYFWHPAYDHYPVVGVSWRQARAFCVWRTQLLNSGFIQLMEETPFQDYRLPTESEWEYAARGGLKGAMYPWGGYYTQNYKGCYIANFKPLRGNYAADGGIYTLIVASNDPNEWGLYDMGGNVSEWTNNAFDESAYSWTDDLNPDYTYEALPDDPPVRKRKIIRGGSWKDISYYMQCGTRSYEYQDSAKSYIGFRCVRHYLGRDFNDASSGSQVY
ncbi:MAG: gliding motility-associated lipoprotein [Bacteroidetes bacterium CG23_combo_of_CG06-09_8_20_14_all_32_9]|nr:MAG: gliding motility-associated lipoprotein [Bacteroidetes bacterium CG23_combo_of_CG06-09_8_20_14_all_32_9]